MTNPDTITDQLAKPAPHPEEERMEAERIGDVLLLLEELSRREEITVKLILDCLYDVGAKNLINQKVRSRSLNQLMKWTARLSKPVFRIVAWRWFKKNVPELLTNWLHSKVTFEPKQKSKAQPPAQPPPQPVTVVEVPEDAVSARELIRRDQEIRQLRAQVRYLTGLLVGAIVALGGAVAWIYYQPNTEVTVFREQLPWEASNPESKQSRVKSQE
jgi:hypothetical protein